MLLLYKPYGYVFSLGMARFVLHDLLEDRGSSLLQYRCRLLYNAGRRLAGLQGNTPAWAVQTQTSGIDLIWPMQTQHYVIEPNGSSYMLCFREGGGVGCMMSANTSDVDVCAQFQLGLWIVKSPTKGN